jgi:hypothetical protein
MAKRKAKTSKARGNAKRKAIKKKSSSKQSAPTKKPALKQAGRSAQQRGKRTASDSLKLATLARAGVRAVEVHFRGCDDDGNFSYRVVGKTRELADTEEREIEKFLAKHFSFYGECEGSVLIGRLDLQNCVWTGFSGGGGPHERLAELIGDLESHGVRTLVVEVKAGKCSKPKLNPQTAMSPSDARSSVEWFLQRIRSYFIEGEGYVPADAEAVAAINQHAWEPSASTLKVDTQARSLSLSGTSVSKPIDAKVDLAKSQKTFCLLD